jgi:hypothetical protein
MKLREVIHIIGEGLTEKYYFKHLKSLKGFRCSTHPRFFANQAIYQYEKKIEEILSADAIAICIFDTDIYQNKPKEKIKLNQFIKKYSKSNNVIICDSLPSIEFCFFLHFKKIGKYFSNYKEIATELKKYIPDYDKKEKYLKQDKWVRVLVEKMETAMSNSKSFKENTQSYSNIYKAIEILSQ